MALWDTYPEVPEVGTTTWEQLILNSYLSEDHTALEHLFAQTGGSGGTFLVSKLSVDLLDNGTNVELKEKIIDVTILE